MNTGGRKGNWVTQARRHHARTWVVDFKANRAEDPPSWTTTVASEQLGIEQPFPGTDPATWARWILEQSVLPVAGEPSESAEPPGGPGEEPVADGTPTVAAEENKLEVDLLDLVEVRPGVDSLGSEFEARIEVSASGSGPATAGASAPYCRLEILAVNEESGLPLLLGSAVERLAPRGSSRPVTVTFRPPDIGAYRLVCLGFCFVPGLCLASTRRARARAHE